MQNPPPASKICKDPAASQGASMLGRRQAMPALAAATASFGWMAPVPLLCCAARCAMPRVRSCTLTCCLNLLASACNGT